MKSFQIKTIQPQLLNNASVSSWFTLRNEQNINSDKVIAGLNLGFNTDENERVIKENRLLLLVKLQIDRDKIAFANQIHKTRVRTVTEGGVYENTDAFVTQVRGLALAIQVADCAAVLFGDEKNGVIGAVHAGWRGAIAGIISKTIQAMIKLGADARHIKAFVSPCISTAKFEVGEEVAQQFPDDFVDYISYKKPHIDLKGFIKNQLLRGGLAKQHLQIEEGCTFSEERFYSYRRQKEKSGRMMGIIKLNE